MSDARDGKRAVHNWANLPPEVLRLVVANYLAYKPHSFTPASWLHPDFYYQRSVFETLRDAYDVERIMRVCPQWHNSLLNMDFWTAACRKFDRADILNRPAVIQRDHVHLQQLHSHSQQPQQQPPPQHLQQQRLQQPLSPQQPQLQQQHATANVVGLTSNPFRKNFNHFRTLTRMCCIPCRINRPLGREGIGNVKASITTAHFGQVSVCKNHRVNYFCGVCLKDVTLASEGDHGQLARVPESLFENEDFDTWPSVHTTCFHCRREALLRTVAHYSSTTSIDLYNFIGGPTLEAKDYEARSTVENFVDMAEGGVNDVINVLLERHWLRINTNLGSLLDQAVASARYSRAEIEDYESEDDMLSDDEEDSYDMLQSQEENGIRMLAVAAWARTRIMDGNWVTPGDLWCIGTGQLPHDSSWDPSILPPTLYPVPYSLQTSPSNQLSHSTGISDNDRGEDTIVPSSTIDPSFAVHYPITDRFLPLPSYRFAQLTSTCFRNTMREILFEPLRHLVYKIAQEAQAMKQDPCVRLAKVELDDILVMLRDEGMWYVNSAHGNTRLAHHIPYIPVSTENMAPMTKNLLDSLWREACAPLYQCRCSICDRGFQRQAQAQGQRTSVPPPMYPGRTVITTVTSPPAPPPIIVAVKQPEVNILLEEEEEIQEMEEEEDAVMNADADVDGDVNTPITTLTPPETGCGSGSDVESNRSRKRSSASIDEDEDGANDFSDGASPRFSIPNAHENGSPASSFRKKQRTMSSEDIEEDGEDDSVTPSNYNVAKPRSIVPIPVPCIPSNKVGEETVCPTSSSPASSISSPVSELTSSSPSSVSSDSSSLHSVTSGPIISLGNRLVPIKPGTGVGVRPGSDGGGSGGVGMGDTVKIRGKDDTPALLYDGGHAREDMEGYYA